MYLLIYLLVEKYKKFIDYLPPVENGVPFYMVWGGKKIVPDFVLADVFRARDYSEARSSSPSSAASLMACRASLNLSTSYLRSSTAKAISLALFSKSVGSINIQL